MLDRLIKKLKPNILKKLSTSHECSVNQSKNLLNGDITAYIKQCGALQEHTVNSLVNLMKGVAAFQLGKTIRKKTISRDGRNTDGLNIQCVTIILRL